MPKQKRHHILVDQKYDNIRELRHSVPLPFRVIVNLHHLIYSNAVIQL
jgi:hypothetical protein